MSTRNESRFSETTTWAQQRVWSGRLSEKEYRKRRVSWNPFIGNDQPNLPYGGDYEATEENDDHLLFWKAISDIPCAFDKISDCLEPEDNSIEIEYALEETQIKKAEALLNQINAQNGQNMPSSTKQTSHRKVRKRSFVLLLKQLYDYRCQVCSERLPCPNLNIPGYTEGHHIQPLERHDGPDIAENVIIVCPNHHILLEHGGMKLNLNKLLLLKHPISKKFVDYHLREIFDDT